jgi:hypothetical protein
MSQSGLLLAVGACALLAAPGAAGRANVPVSPPPSITPIVTGTLGTNGWYRSDVTVNWVIDPLPLSSIGCDARTLVADTPGTRLTCSATFSGGVEITMTITVKLDRTAPTVRGAADRPPDANGWYNRPFNATFSGTDPTAGIAACSTVGYGGPDGAPASVSGACTDSAGNVGSGLFSFKYDATPPGVSALRIKPGKKLADIAWKATADTVLAEVARTPGPKGAAEAVVYRGAATSYRDLALKPGRKYRYTVMVYDEAANRASQAIDFVGRGALLSPAPGERVTSPPLLVWTAVKGATYYNVVLIRGRRVFSAWPSQPRLQLRRTWLYRGRRQQLRPGVYRWYTWPGYGALRAGRFGPPLGGSTFIVTR